MSLESALFASAARRTPIEFRCAREIRVGAYKLLPGDKMKAVSAGFGLFHVYVDWAEGSIGRLNHRDVNKIAGQDVILCSCTDPVHPGDNSYCLVHGRL